MEWYVVLILAFAAAIPMFLIGLGIRIAYGAFHPKRLSLLETRALEAERTPDLLAQYDAWEKIPYAVRSPLGYDLRTYFLPTADRGEANNRRFVVIAHGFSYNHHGSIKYAHLMKRLGFNVVMYDQRFHGESGGDSCTLGFHERGDLRAVVDDTFRRFGDDLFLGTYGESMGAVTALLEQADDDRIRFVVSDCAFASMHDELAYLVKRTGYLPVQPALWIGEQLFRARTKADPAAVRPIDAVARAKCPMLFIHGESDGFVPAGNGRRLYDACSSAKDLYIAGNQARHAESYRKNRADYETVLNRFMNDKVLGI